VPDGATEHELKLLLRDEAQWEYVRRALGPPLRVLDQRNTYLDTPDGRLSRDRTCMVRVREESGRFWLQVKDRARRAGSTVTSRERSAALAPDAARDLLAGRVPLRDMAEPLCRAVAAEIGADLRPAGRVENHREVYVLPGGYQVELDRTRFPDGHVDCEIEIELGPNQTAAAARRALEAQGVPAGLLRPSPTKYERFLAHRTG